jgi:hypothetical protein
MNSATRLVIAVASAALVSYAALLDVPVFLLGGL